MDAGLLRLGVRYGAGSTTAVVCGPGGRWRQVLFDGQPLLPAEVGLDCAGGWVTGPAARTAARAGCYVPDPAAHLGDGTVAVGGAAVEVVDLVAVTLRRVRTEAASVADAAPGRVVIAGPAGWGPQRRMVLRQAAQRAGFTEVEVIAAPAGVGAWLVASGVPVPAGWWLGVFDISAGFEASVVRRTGGGGWDVLATMDADAGTRRIDDVLARRILTAAGPGGPQAAAVVAGFDPAVVAAAGVARQALPAAGAVAVPLADGRPAVVLTLEDLHAAAMPVLDVAAETARRTVEVAEADPGRCAGLVVVGEAARLPWVQPRLADAVKPAAEVELQVLDEAWLAAALGAADATATTAVFSAVVPAGAVGMAAGGSGAEEPGPRLWRALAPVPPAVVSLALVAQFLTGARVIETVVGSYVLANWGELALASVAAMMAALASAALIGAVLPLPKPRPGGPVVPGPGYRFGAGLLAGTGAGFTVAVMYVLLTAVTFGHVSGSVLRWALLPAAAVALPATAIAVLALRAPAAPRGGWHSLLGFPQASLVCVGVGMLAFEYFTRGGGHTADAVLRLAGGRGGAALLGAGIAFATVQARWAQAVLVLALGLFTAAVIGWNSTGLLAVLYTAVVTGWWLRRLWRAARALGPATWPPSVGGPARGPAQPW